MQFCQACQSSVYRSYPRGARHTSTRPQACGWAWIPRRCGLKNGHRICMVTSMGTESDGTSHVMSGTRPLPASSCRPLVLAKHVAKQIGRHSGRKHSKPGRSGGSALLSPVLKVMLEEHSTQRRWRTAEMSRSLMTLAVSSPNCPILQRSLMQGNSHRRLRLESTPSCQQRTGS